MLISSMPIFAGTTSKTIGVVAEDKATCSLATYTYGATARTTPVYPMDCRTQVWTVGKEDVNYAQGTTYASANYNGGGNARSGHSAHQAGNNYTTLEVAV